MTYRLMLVRLSSMVDIIRPSLGDQIKVNEGTTLGNPALLVAKRAIAIIPLHLSLSLSLPLSPSPSLPLSFPHDDMGTA